MESILYMSKRILLLIVSLGIIIVFSTSSALADTEGPYTSGSGSNISTIGTEPWLAPGEITSPGSPYSSAKLYHLHLVSNYLQGTQYGFNLPPEASILGIQVFINRMSTGNNPSIRDNVVGLVKDGIVVGENKANPSAWPTTLSMIGYGGTTDLWGADWTPEEINSPGFGVVLSTIRDNNGNNDRTAIVDTLQITVYYNYVTTLSVVCGDGNPIVYGESTICVSTVTSAASDLTPTGNVSWSSDMGGSFEPNPCVLNGDNGVSTCSATYTPDTMGISPHFITASYAGDGFFAPSSGEVAVEVVRRPITVTADPQSKIYTHTDPELTYQVSQGSLVFGDTFTGTLTREQGENAGLYAILQGSLALPDDYMLTYVGNNLTILKAEATCNVTAYSVVYDGTSFTATGSCSGVLGEPLEGLDLSGTMHMNAGTYLDSWYFIDVTGNYNDQSGEVLDTIEQADAICDVVPYDVVFDGLEHTAEGTCIGVQGEPLVGLDLSGTTHTNAGAYTDLWSFIDETGNYHDQDGMINDAIGMADAVCEVTPYEVVYDGMEHTAEGFCNGVLGEPLEGLDLYGTTHSASGAYTDAWFFTDETGNYNNQDGIVEDNISKAQATCSVEPYSVAYDREQHTATGECIGVMGEILVGLNLDNTTHVEIGTYPDDPWIFTDVTGNYIDLSGTVDDEITLRSVTVTADAISKLLGQPDPELTYQVTAGSLLTGDMFTGSLERQPGERINIYIIMQGTLSLPDYYTITYVGADFTIYGIRHVLPIVMR